MKNKQLILFISGITLFLFFIKTGSTVSEIKIENRAFQPSPVRAPAPVIAEMHTTPEPERTITSQPQPRPQPVPTPPGTGVSEADQPPQPATGNLLPTMLFVGTVGLFTGFLILFSRRRPYNDRYTKSAIAANGAQS